MLHCPWCSASCWTTVFANAANLNVRPKKSIDETVSTVSRIASSAFCLSANAAASLVRIRPSLGSSGGHYQVSTDEKDPAIEALANPKALHIGTVAPGRGLTILPRGVSLGRNRSKTGFPG